MRFTRALLVMAVLGCGSDAEDVAAQALSSEGYEDVSVTRSGSTFSFQASRAGQSCVGSVGISEGLLGTTVSAVTGDCVEPSDADRCRAGAAAACVSAGMAARESDPTEAAALWARGCELGDAEACHDSGAAHEGMPGIPPDPARALHFYERACEHGLAVACHDAAVFHTRGRTGPANAARGRELYERACGAGHQDACVDVAASLVEEDPPRAVQLLQAACRAGHMVGCKNLGLLHLGGDAGLERDQARGVEILGGACTAGEESSCGVLALYATLGNARPEAGEAALSYLRAACESSRQPACAAIPDG